MKHVAITTLLVLGSSLLVQSEQWIKVKPGEVPENAVAYKPRGKSSKAFFCSTLDKNTGIRHTGVTPPDHDVCEYITRPHNLTSEEHPEVLRETDYNTLVLDEGEQYKFEYSKDGPPPNAIACDKEGDHDCYLGRSMYQDGLCVKDIGKIHADVSLIHLIEEDETHVCSFYTYLTIYKTE